jgi:hypothetical protein
MNSLTKVKRSPRTSRYLWGSVNMEGEKFADRWRFCFFEMTGGPDQAMRLLYVEVRYCRVGDVFLAPDGIPQAFLAEARGKRDF